MQKSRLNAAAVGKPLQRQRQHSRKTLLRLRVPGHASKPAHVEESYVRMSNCCSLK
jgi:hypothetical protein